MVSKIEQPTGGDGKPLAALAVEWKQRRGKWSGFISTEAVAIENVVVKQDGNKTQIQFKSRDIQNPSKFPGAGLILFWFTRTPAAGDKGLWCRFR